MERRSFLLGLMALATGSALSLPADEAPAASPTLPAEVTPGAASEITLPDGTPVDWAQRRSSDWDRRHRPPPHHRHRPRHHRRRRQRQVCHIRRDRWGRPVRICRWVWHWDSRALAPIRWRPPGSFSTGKRSDPPFTQFLNGCPEAREIRPDAVNQIFLWPYAFREL